MLTKEDEQDKKKIQQILLLWKREYQAGTKESWQIFFCLRKKELNYLLV